MQIPLQFKEKIVSKPSKTKSRIRIRSEVPTEEPADGGIQSEEGQESADMAKRVRLSADIDRNVMVDLKIRSAVTGSSIAMIVQEIVRDYLTKTDQIDQALVNDR